VPHFVEQLAAQEPDSTFARAGCSVKENSTMMGKIIQWVKRPRVQHPLRLTLKRRGAVRARAFSPEGARLAQAVDDDVVVSDSTTGFTLSTLSCGAPVMTIAFKYNMIVAGCWNGTIKLFKLNESQDWGEIQSEPPLSCGSEVLTIALKDDMIVAGCFDGKIKLFKLNEFHDWGEIQSEPPLRGHRYVSCLSREYFLSCFRY